MSISGLDNFDPYRQYVEKVMQDIATHSITVTAYKPEKYDGLYFIQFNTAEELHLYKLVGKFGDIESSRLNIKFAVK